VLLLAVIYRYGPNRPDAKWIWISPGSAAATVLWLAGTFGFGLYVSNFGNYNATYGSLGAVIVFLTWLYLSAYIVIMGAELNSEMEERAGQEKVADEAQAQQETSIDNVNAPPAPAESPLAPETGKRDPRPRTGELVWKWGALALLLRILGRGRQAAR
jgi:membrane protein